MESQKGIFFIMLPSKRKNKASSLMSTVNKCSNYDNVRINLLNFTTNENVKSLLELFFVQKDENFF